MTYSVSIFDKSNGWQLLENCTLIYPYSWTRKLDETLDEAQIVCYNSPVKKYKPNTNIKVTITDGATTESHLFKLATDNSENYPNGSLTYKHTLGLVEMTKYLEGVMCQTLTFTNSIASTYTPIPAEFEIERNHGFLQYTGFSVDEIKTGVVEGSTINTTIRYVGQKFAEFLNNHAPLATSYSYLDVYQGMYSNASWTVGQGATQYAPNNDTPVAMQVSDPTEISFNIVIDETGTVPYLVNIRVVVRSSMQGSAKKYTVASVCQRIFDLAEPLYADDTSRFYLSQRDERELGNVIAPEFTISQSNLREQLKMVGSHIHAEPRITDIRWNGRYEYEISFDYYGKNANTNAPTFLKKSYSYNIANYCTRIHTQARNIVNSLSASHTMTDPGKNVYKGLRAEQSNLRINEDNGIVKTAQPIYDLKKVMCGIYKIDGSQKLSPQDITSFCFEATEYDTVLSSFAGAYPRSKTYAIRWKRGEKDITQLFYKAPNAISTSLSPWSIENILSTVSGQSVHSLLADATNQLVFQVQYKPITNTAFLHGKNEYTDDEPFTIAYNQSDSLIEMDYYGENIRGASARMGNAEIQLTCQWEALSDIPQIGYSFVMDGEKYIITDIAFNLYGERIFGTVTATKDFNRISQYIGVNSQKRISEISLDQAYDRDIILEAKLIVGRYENAKIPKLTVPIGAFERLFTDSTTDRRITQCYITRDGSKDKCLLPAMASGYGTTTVLTASMKDNYSAGDAEKHYSEGEIKGFWGYDYQFGDYFGRANKIGVTFVDALNEGRDFAFNYPRPSSALATAGIQCGTLGHFYKCLKDSRERLSTIAIAIEAQTTIPNLTLGSGIAKLNALVANDGRTPNVYLVPFGSELPYKLDETIVDYDTTGWLPRFVTAVSSGNTFYLSKVKNDSTARQGFVIAYPVTSRTITVVDEEGNTVQQTIREGGEILMVSSTHIASNADILGTDYTFRIE